MAVNSGISWTHHTWNPWMGCDKVAPECAHCYIDRIIRRQKNPATGKPREWGEVFRTSPGNWNEPWKWERKAAKRGKALRIFTCSLSDFFHHKADKWRDEAWKIIKNTPHLTYLILTKRPGRIAAHLPADWGNGYPNVWLGVSAGCGESMVQIDKLRETKAVRRFVSAEPLLEDISHHINLEEIDWLIAGGESGPGEEYVHIQGTHFSKEPPNGRRTMRLQWAENLRAACEKQGTLFFFKQITASREGQGADALGRLYQDWPSAPYEWYSEEELQEDFGPKRKKESRMVRPIHFVSGTDQTVARAKSEAGTLANLERARLALAESRTLPEVKKIRDVAEAARVYAKAAHLSREAQNYAGEIALLASRKAGEILKRLQKTPPGGDRRSKQADSVSGSSEYRQALDETNTGERTAERWQKLAEVPEETALAYIAAVRETDDGTITAAGLFKVHAKTIDPKPPKVDFRFAKSPNGHTTDILKSWLQKGIRRGLEEDALYCAVQLDLTGFPGAVWNTIHHVVSEDIGLAETNLPAVIGQLYALWKKDHGREALEDTEDNKPTADGAPERLYMIHAVLLCVRAKKSRLVDNALNLFYTDTSSRAEPDWALDKHTREGRKLGRRFDHFFDVGAVLANEVKLPGDEEYAQRVREKLIAGKDGEAKAA